MFGDFPFNFNEIDTNTSPIADRSHIDGFSFNLKSPSPLKFHDLNFNSNFELFDIPIFDNSLNSNIISEEILCKNNKLSNKNNSKTINPSVKRTKEIDINNNRSSIQPFIHKPFVTFDSIEVTVQSLNSITSKKVQRSLSTPTLKK